jgi:acetyltransferase-like isoleucine patch superfamily enzyme
MPLMTRILRNLKFRCQLIIMRFIQKIRIFNYFLISNAEIHGKPLLHQPLHAVGRGKIIFSAKVNIGVFPSPGFISSYAYIEARNPDSSIQIGEGTSINNGFVAIAEHSQIRIGNRCLIGPNCEIYDSDFHGLNVSERFDSSPAWAKSVVLEDDVFIGGNVIILKGVRIGYGSIVANASVVTKDIPPLAVAGGNPAKIIKLINI